MFFRFFSLPRGSTYACGTQGDAQADDASNELSPAEIWKVEVAQIGKN
jgi:hypothetical protein